MLCGMADSLDADGVLPLLQGVCGAALVPLSQATMLDIYPFERRAQAMAIFGMGVMVGPIIGPTLGGYLTEVYNWRYVFYVNLPFGILAVTGLLIFLPKAAPRAELRFDWTGFAVLAIGVGALQLMLDRGQNLDWFSSREIIIEAVLAGLGLYLFIVHMFTARAAVPAAGPVQGSQLRRVRRDMVVLHRDGDAGELGADGAISGEPGRLSGVRGGAVAGAARPRHDVGMLFASWLSNHVDQRKMMGGGLIVLGLALHEMSGWTPDVSQRQMMTTLMVQGVSIGLIFNPMTVVAFVTLPARLRGDATALQALSRNMGSAIGISVTTFTLARSVQSMHADIAAGVTPFDRMLQSGGAVQQYLSPVTRTGAALLDQTIERQAEIIAVQQ